MITVEIHRNDEHTPLSAVQTAMRQIEARNFLHPKMSILVKHLKLTHNLFFRISHYRPQTKFAKALFLHLSVILFTGWVGGGVCPSACWDTQPQPPPAPEADTTLRTDTPHPWSRPPCTVHAGGYGQQAGGMHPTGMHTCYKCIFKRIKKKKMVPCVSCHFQVTVIPKYN